MTEQSNPMRCAMCERDADEIPLIHVRYKNGGFCICPEHLPILIHEPQQLIGKLDGAEEFKPSDYHD